MAPPWRDEEDVRGRDEDVPAEPAPVARRDGWAISPGAYSLASGKGGLQVLSIPDEEAAA